MTDNTSKPSADDSSTSTRLLVVDDQPEVVSAIQSYFGQQNYTIHTAHDGHEALEIAQSTPLDIIVTDLLMPKMDGIELCRHLKENPETADIGLIVLTAVDKLDSRLSVLRYGADDYVTKPFSFQELGLRLSLQARATAQRREVKTALQGEQRKTNNLEIVAEMARSITALSSNDLHEICDATVHSLVDRFGYEYVSIFQYDEDARESELYAKAGSFIKAPDVGYRFPIETGILGLVQKTGKTYLSNDVQNDPNFAPNPVDPVTWKKIQSEICVPIKAANQVFGCINIESIQSDAFEVSDQLMLETLAGHLAVALTNIQLYRESIERNTALQKAYAELQEAQSSIIETEREKAALDTALQTGLTLSHEINNPLTAIIGFAELMAKEFPEKSEYKIILDAGHRIADVVSRLRKLKTIQLRPYVSDIPISMIDLDAKPDTLSKDEPEQTVSLEEQTNINR